MGVNFVACQMTMGIMAIKKEELLDNISIAGVSKCISTGSDSGINILI